MTTKLREAEETIRSLIQVKADHGEAATAHQEALQRARDEADQNSAALEDGLIAMGLFTQSSTTGKLEGMQHPACRQFLTTDPFCREPLRRTAERPVTAPCEDSLHHRLSLGEVLLPRGRVRHRRDVSEVAFAFAWLTARLQSKRT